MAQTDPKCRKPANFISSISDDRGEDLSSLICLENGKIFPSPWWSVVCLKSWNHSSTSTVNPHSWGSQSTEECSNRLSRILIRRYHNQAKITTKLEELTYCGMSISDVFTKDCLRPLHRLHFPEGNGTLRTLASEECFLCCGSDVSSQIGSQLLNSVNSPET